MKRISTKTAAESALRELPSVLGAYVSEDMEGHPREIHLLVRNGPDTATLARDIRGLLEERLGIPIDQRVISIAQLARDASEVMRPHAGATPDAGEAVETVEQGAVEPGQAEAHAESQAAEAGEATAAEAEEAASAKSPGRAPAQGSATKPPQDMGRPLFAGLESSTTSGQFTVSVRLQWQGRESQGTADAVDTQPGRARAAAAATLRSAADAPWNDDLGLELDFASIVQALDGEYVLVSVLGMASRLGRRPLPLVGVHPVESDVESAAALAALKAINRVLSLALKPD